MGYRHDWTPGRKCRKCLLAQPPRDKVTKRRAVAPPCPMERSRRRGDGAGPSGRIAPPPARRTLAAPHGFITVPSPERPYHEEMKRRVYDERHRNTPIAENPHAIAARLGISWRRVTALLAELG